MISVKGCPGSGNVKGAQTLTVKICPKCGSEIEIFSADLKVICEGCGFIAYNDTQNCIMWCRYARECVGDAVYKRFAERRSGSN